MQRSESVRRVLVAFIIIAILSISNTPAIYGFEVYPLGTFVFFALFYLAYGLFKFNVGIALQYIRGIIFGSGLMVIAVVLGFIPVFLMPGQDTYVRLFAGLLLVSVLYYPSKTVWDRVLSLFIRKSSDVFKESIFRLTNDLSRVHHRDKIHQMFCAWLFETLEGSMFISLFSLSDLSGQKIYVGWKSWNTMNEAGLFGADSVREKQYSPLNVRKDHPLIEACSYEQGICTKEHILSMNPSMHAFNGSEGLLDDTEIIIPVHSKGRLLAVMLLGRKSDGSSYSHNEFEMIQNIYLALGPLIENAMLLEELEEKVDKRTWELNNALKESVKKEKEISENNEIITRQNQIFRTLLETSTKIHHLDTLDELFSFILSQLRTLFNDFRGGIILENTRRNILEATSFIGISEAEQKVI
ncbi:hypothetical protein EG833_02540, partial [archaeon]|nr:hypothetical protein [archaeon]